MNWRCGTRHRQAVKIKEKQIKTQVVCIGTKLNTLFNSRNLYSAMSLAFVSVNCLDSFLHSLNYWIPWGFRGTSFRV